MKKPLAVMIGAGEGLGFSLAKTFSDAGYQVVVLNRSLYQFPLDDVLTFKVDAAHTKTVKETLAKIINDHGVPEVLVHNPAQLTINPFMQTSIEDFQSAWNSMVLSAINTLHVVLPLMVQQGKGSILVSGATGSLRGGANFSAFASAKFALRGLIQSLAREYQPQGIHIAHVILDGILDTPRSRNLHSLDPADMMLTDDVAETYLQLVQQKPSVWTHELDLRTKNENF